MERFCKDLRDQAMKIINYEKKEIIPLTNEEKNSYEKQKVCYICENNSVQIKNIVKSEIIVITQENLEEPLIIFVI